MPAGRILPPYGGITLCAGAECRVELSEETEAYLHSNRVTGGLVVFCGACSMKVQMYMSLEYPLVAL